MNFKISSIFLIFILCKHVASMIVDKTQDFSEECIKAHNVKRRLHGAPDLVYSDELSGHAENGAYQSALKGKMIIPEGAAFGQNIAYSTTKRSCDEVVDLWYNANKYYDFNEPMFKSESGPFTQVVWKDSKRIACSQHSENSEEYYSVCVYDPPGNVNDERSFQENVAINPYSSYSTEALEEKEINSIDMQSDSIVDRTNQAFLNNCCQAHNKIRKQYGVNDLVFDQMLLNYTKRKAFDFAAYDQFDYSDIKFGYNYISGNKPLDCNYAVDTWYEQKKFDDYSSPASSDEPTRFVQLVWKDTKNFACATVELKDSSKYYLACIYGPVGPTTGPVGEQYENNILPERRRVISINMKTILVTTSRPRTSTIKPNKELDTEFFGVSIFRHGAG